jgi:hypothetical protein
MKSFVFACLLASSLAEELVQPTQDIKEVDMNRTNVTTNLTLDTQMVNKELELHGPVVDPETGQEIDEERILEILDEMDLSDMPNIDVQSIVIDPYADFPHLRPIELQFDERHEDPHQNPEYTRLPKRIRDLVDKYGYDIPEDLLERVQKSYYMPTRGLLKRRKARDRGMGTINVFGSGT